MTEDDFVISRYTNEQAIADGIKVALGPSLFVTTALAIDLAPVSETDIITNRDDGQPVLFDPRVLYGHVAAILARYNASDYGDDPESDANMATYEIDGHRVWAILDGDGLTLLRPEDY